MCKVKVKKSNQLHCDVMNTGQLKVELVIDLVLPGREKVKLINASFLSLKCSPFIFYVES